MAFAVEDFHDLARLLNEHPEWRAELRRLVLSDELLALPTTVQALAEAQHRTEQRVEELAEAQHRTEQRVEELAIEIQALTQSVNSLVALARRTDDRVGALVGTVLEMRYRDHAAGYFGRWLRKAQAVAPFEIEDTLETLLPLDEIVDVLRLDLLVRGRWRALAERPEVWLAVEVSPVVDEGDVARAWRRARLLQQAGYRALPVVAGEAITEDARASALAQSVGIVQDGQATLDVDLNSWFVN